MSLVFPFCINRLFEYGGNSITNRLTFDVFQTTSQRKYAPSVLISDKSEIKIARGRPSSRVREEVSLQYLVDFGSPSSEFY